MSIVIALVVGAIVGWLAAAFTGRSEGIFGSMVIGIVGAIIGGFLSGWISGTSKSYLQFSWSGIFWSFLGALILSALLNMLGKRGQKRV